jgi:hypothetical protein
MNAVVKPSPKEETLFSLYASEAEIAEVRNASEAIYIAEEKVEHVLSVLRTVNDQIRAAHRGRVVDYDRAAAVALGEAQPAAEAPYAGLSISQLEQQQKGLERRADEAREQVTIMKGKFRAAIFELLRKCAERCAADYDEATRRQAWCYQQITLAQGFVGDYKPLVDYMVWNRYVVPGSEHIPLLKQRSREENFLPLLMSTDRVSLGLEAAKRGLAQHGRELFGEWPL